jgi:Phage integrase family/Phage integrase, N-terminal SAM-like domain
VSSSQSRSNTDQQLETSQSESTPSPSVRVKNFASDATILPRIRQGHDPTKGGDTARTRYQYGEIVVKHGKAHDSWMGRWKEDVRLPNGSIARKKRSRVFGIVGEMTEKQARRQLETILTRVKDPGYVPESNSTFQALAQEWSDQAFPEMKPSTVLNMRGHLTNHLLPFFGTRQVRELTTRDIDAFLSKLTVSRKTKKNVFSTLKLILKQGRAWGNVRENIWEAVKKIGKSETEVRAYADAEVESILSRSTGAKRLFYWLAVETGVRAGELCGLRVCDVDPFRKLVRVRQAVWRGKIQTPKTKNAIREIPIPVQIVDALRVQIGSREVGFVFTTKKWYAVERGPSVETAPSQEAESCGRSSAYVPAHVRNAATSRGSARSCCVQAVRARQRLNDSEYLRSRSGRTLGAI